MWSWEAYVKLLRAPGYLGQEPTEARVCRKAADVLRR